MPLSCRRFVITRVAVVVNVGMSRTQLVVKFDSAVNDSAVMNELMVQKSGSGCRPANANFLHAEILFFNEMLLLLFRERSTSALSLYFYFVFSDGVVRWWRDKSGAPARCTEIN